MSEENIQDKISTDAPNREKGRDESRDENRKSLIAFLKSIRFRRGGKRAKVAECDGHFAGLQSKVEGRRTQDETLAVRSAN